MKKTIESRITMVMAIALTLVSLTGFLALYYFQVISSDVDKIIRDDILAARSTETLKTIVLNLKRGERNFLDSLRENSQPYDLSSLLIDLKDEIIKQQKLNSSSAIQDRLNDLDVLASEYLDTLEKYSSPERSYSSNLTQLEQDLQKITEYMQEIVSSLLSERYLLLESHQIDIEVVVSKVHRNMLLFIFISITSGIILIFMSPKKVTEPIRKFIATVREMQQLKFDTRIPVTGNNELTELAQELNRLLDTIQLFDEMKQRRIQFEHSKQRVLANMLDQGVMMVAIEGNLIFMNDQLVRVLGLDSSDYQGVEYQLVRIPEELKEMIEEVLKIKERINSRMMILKAHDSDESKMVEVLVDVGLVRNNQGNVVNLVITFEDITNPDGSSVFKRISILEQSLV